jgi:hypothetical protein
VQGAHRTPISDGGLGRLGTLALIFEAARRPTQLDRFKLESV